MVLAKAGQPAVLTKVLPGFNEQVDRVVADVEADRQNRRSHVIAENRHNRGFDSFQPVGGLSRARD